MLREGASAEATSRLQGASRARAALHGARAVRRGHHSPSIPALPARLSCTSNPPLACDAHPVIEIHLAAVMYCRHQCLQLCGAQNQPRTAQAAHIARDGCGVPHPARRPSRSCTCAAQVASIRGEPTFFTPPPHVADLEPRWASVFLLILSGVRTERRSAAAMSTSRWVLTKAAANRLLCSATAAQHTSRHHH